MTDHVQPEEQKPDGGKPGKPKMKPGSFIAVGIAVGTALGVAMGNIAVGVAVGVAIGAGMAASQRKK